jgi:hypothetical protein
MQFNIMKAVRRRTPMLISVAGVSGSGKTYSSLLLAAGLAGPNGRVGFLDTENGRGSMYADSPGIKAALPNGYEIADMREPFAPSRYTDAIQDFVAAGVNVLVIDSMTHEWEGYGGCADIAEKGRQRGMDDWATAKREHKRFMNRMLASSIDIICCLRAREMIEIKKAGGKTEVVQLGVQPVCEKNFMYEMTLSMMIEAGTHRPLIQKCPEPLLPLFQGETPLVTKDMGAKLLAWCEGGSKVAAPQRSVEELQQQALHYANDGIASYQSYWKSLTNDERTLLKPYHDDNKAIATQADEGSGNDAA